MKTEFEIAYEVLLAFTFLMPKSNGEGVFNPQPPGKFKIHIVDLLKKGLGPSLANTIMPWTLHPPPDMQYAIQASSEANSFTVLFSVYTKL